MAEKAMRMGVQSSDIFYDLISRDTIQNWNEAGKIIKENNFKKIILVSSPFHLLRIENMINIGNGIEAYYSGYEGNSDLYPKSFFENFSEYNYNMISIMAYYILPSGLYQGTISRLRG